MIATIRGEVTAKTEDSVIIEVGGIGYELHIAVSDIDQLSIGEETQLHVYEHIRDDAHDLYGFAELGGKELFIQLIGVSGVGPKVGMAIISSYKFSAIRDAIATGDNKLLQSVSGVGKRTSERIIVELKDKVASIATVESGEKSAAAPGSDVLEALEQLGYSRAQAQRVLSSIPDDIDTAEEKVKYALKNL